MPLTTNDYIPGDERWDTNDLSGTRNNDGTWDVVIRARVRTHDEIGARAFFAPGASPEFGLAKDSNVATGTGASALVRGADDPLTPSSITMAEATVGVGQDNFSSVREGL